MVSSPSSHSESSLTIRRTFPARRERVFRAWTNPAALRQWSCPEGFTLTAAEVDLRVGGAFRLAMQPAGGDAPSVAYGTYREVTPPARLVYTWRWEGNEMPETLVTVEFRDLGGETEVVLLHERFRTPDLRDQHNGGWSSILDKLARALPTLP